MDIRRRVLFEARAGIMKALAHASRLMIVDELSDGERCVCELRDVVGADMSTVSKHLSVLRNAGLVEDEKRGLRVFYRLKVPCVLGFMACVQSVLETQVREKQSLLECHT